MNKKIIAALLCAASVLTALSAFADSLPENEIISQAVSAGIIDNSDLNKSENVTREQFCGYVYNMLNSMKELPQAKLTENPFDDVTDYKINALFFSEVICGKDNRVFSPKDNITQEEAAVILYRAAKLMEFDLPLAKVDSAAAQKLGISDWAVSAVYSLKIADIMDVTEPKKAVTVEQALASIMKLYTIIKK